MSIDTLDILVIAGLALVTLYFWLEGYPVAIAGFGAILLVAGLLPQLKGRRK